MIIKKIISSYETASSVDDPILTWAKKEGYLTLCSFSEKQLQALQGVIKKKPLHDKYISVSEMIKVEEKPCIELPLFFVHLNMRCEHNPSLLELIVAFTDFLEHKNIANVQCTLNNLEDFNALIPLHGKNPLKLSQRKV